METKMKKIYVVELVNGIHHEVEANDCTVFKEDGTLVFFGKGNVIVRYVLTNVICWYEKVKLEE